jgi:hypothetical protein
MADYQRYATLLDENSATIHQLAPEATIVVDEYEHRGFEHQKGKVDLVSFQLPLPIQSGGPNKSNAFVSYHLRRDKETFEIWMTTVSNLIKSFIRKAQFLMPQGAHTRPLSSRISITPEMRSALGSSLGFGTVDFPVFTQFQGLTAALQRMEPVLEKLPASVKFELNQEEMKEVACWGLMKQSFPDLPEAATLADPDHQEYSVTQQKAKQLLKDHLYGFEAFQATYPKADRISESTVDYWTVKMTLEDRFGQPYSKTVGIMPIQYGYTYDYGQFDPEKALLKEYAKAFDYDGFVQNCLKRTQQWIQLLKPEGHDAMHLKDV